MSPKIAIHDTHPRGGNEGPHTWPSMARILAAYEQTPKKTRARLARNVAIYGDSPPTASRTPCNETPPF